MYSPTRWIALVLVVLGVVIAVRPVSAEDVRDRKIIARVEITRPDLIAETYARNIDILEDHPNPASGYFTVLLTAAELAELEGDGYKLQVLDYDWYKTYASKAVQVPNGGFSTYDDGAIQLEFAHFLYPNITSARFSIGQTVEGREMWAIKVSDNPDVDEDEIEILLSGMHHAREPIGQEILLTVLDQLTSGYGVDPTITALVDNREIYIVPVVNPDGYEYNRVIAPEGGGLWRKNRNPVYGTGNSRGVDLNRNYGYLWGYDNGGSSPSTASETYRGPSAFSEPETQNMRAFVNAHEFLFALNYHSYSNLYLWPWGYETGAYTEDQDFLAGIGDSLATYNGYTAQIGWALYPTNGDADDWMYGATAEHPKIMSYTPEVGNWFWPDPFEIAGLVAENLGPTLALIGMDYVDMSATPTFGPAPLTVDFNGIHRTNQNSWFWELGDGDTANVINPSHLYQPGHYTVTVQSTGPISGATNTKTDFITAVAESLNVVSDMATAGESFVWDIGLTNHVALSEIKFAIALSNMPAFGKLDSVSFVGTRLADFEQRQLIFDNGFFGQQVVNMIADDGGGTPPLPPGSGTVARLFLKLSGAATPGDSILLDLTQAVSGHPMTGITLGHAFGLIGTTGALEILAPPCACDCHGDPQCDGQVNVLDVVKGVNVAFKGQAEIPDPNAGCPYNSTDVDCSGLTNILDIVRMVNVAFKGSTPTAEYCKPCGP